MRNSIFFLLMVMFVNSVNSQSRWRNIQHLMWDTQSAVVMGASKVRFFYEYPFLDEQRNFMVRHGMMTSLQASEIKFGRTGVVANCSTNEYGIFHAAQLNSSKVPIDSPANVPLAEVKMEFMAPETDMEAVVNDACRYFKLKR